jgi:DNA topoisomerase-2
MASALNKSVSDAPNKNEETYQLLEQLDHILKRPETYIGSNRPCREVKIFLYLHHFHNYCFQEMWVVDDSGLEGPKIIKKEITYVPGLYKIFDEILGKKNILKIISNYYIY